LKISLRVDLFDGSEFAVGNPLVPLGCGDLHVLWRFRFALDLR
jgi:hypothetical protein